MNNAGSIIMVVSVYVMLVMIQLKVKAISADIHDIKTAICEESK